MKNLNFFQIQFFLIQKFFEILEFSKILVKKNQILDRQKILVKKNQIFVKKTLSFLKIQKTTKNFHGCEKSRTASLHHL